MVHVLWECPAYKDTLVGMHLWLNLDLLGESFEDFESVGIGERLSFVLDCDLWEKNFESLLCSSEGMHYGKLGRFNCMEFQALLSLSLGPRLGI